MLFHLKGNKRAEKSQKVPLSEFYIEEIGTTPQLLLQDVMIWKQIKWGIVKVKLENVKSGKTNNRFNEIENEHAPFLILYGGEEDDQTSAIFCRYPFLLDLTSKISIFKCSAEVTKVFLYSNVC